MRLAKRLGIASSTTTMCWYRKTEKVSIKSRNKTWPTVVRFTRHPMGSPPLSGAKQNLAKAMREAVAC